MGHVNLAEIVEGLNIAAAVVRSWIGLRTKSCAVHGQKM